MLKSAPGRALRVGRTVVAALRWRADGAGARMISPTPSAWTGEPPTRGDDAMDNVADPAGRLDPRNPLIRWVDEMQTVTKMITGLIEDSERYRGITESAQREHEALRAELGHVRAELQDE